MKSDKPAAYPSKHRYMVAVVLGTALGALGPTTAQAAPKLSHKTVSDLTRYCTACWRNAKIAEDRWTDCTQEVFKRLIDRVPVDRWKQLLNDEYLRRDFFRCIDAVKKKTQRDRKRYTELSSVVADRRQTDDKARQEERAAVLDASQSLLSERQQQILAMSLDGWSVQEIAHSLTVPAERVSDEKYKAVKKLRQHFASESLAS